MEAERLASHDRVATRAAVPAALDGRRLRFLSYNIQTGILSARYGHYVLHSWKHLLPFRNRWANLDRIGKSLAGFDVVGLQELDSGSLRTGFINQAKYLAEQANFPFWHYQTTRRLGKLAQHSNGLLARIAPHELTDYKLPGLRGRGALLARFGTREEPLALFIIHLSLGRRARLKQMDFISERVQEYRHAVVMGDLNCGPDSREMKLLLQRTHLLMPSQDLSTFPSWRPRRDIDHILVSASLRVERTYVPEWLYSDHLPVAMDVLIPASVHLAG